MDPKKLLQNLSCSLLIVTSCFIPNMHAANEVSTESADAESVAKGSQVSGDSTNQKNSERAQVTRPLKKSEQKIILACQKKEAISMQKAAKVLGVDLKAKNAHPVAKSCWGHNYYFYQITQHTLKTKGPKG